MSKQPSNNEENVLPELGKEAPAVEARETPPDTNVETEADSAAEAKPSEAADVKIMEDEVLQTLVAELAEAKQTADEALDEALRAQAELQNFRRRKERETNDRITQANARLINDLLPVLDDFERAFENAPTELSDDLVAWTDGFRLILRKFQTVLEREGVTAIDASGEFDPTLHEAISMEPNDEVESGHIIAEVRRGYMLKDRVLRPSVVRVAQ